MSIKQLIAGLSIIVSLCYISPASAATLVADWGSVASPLTNSASFSFAQYDITNNFADQYAFSLEGSSDTTYAVTFNFDPCKNGCGNPNLSYGIYDANGSILSASNGSITLSSGNYIFQVKGAGMGNGNNASYFGTINFSAIATELVSPAPEPSSLILIMAGLCIVTWAIRRRRLQERTNPAGYGQRLASDTGA